MARNAADLTAAKSGRGVVTIGSQTCAPGELLVTIADHGDGVAAENLDRIFEPLFTTKPAGMGMGLPICRSIIEAHGGRIWVSPNTPQGAIFQFTVPHGAAEP